MRKWHTVSESADGSKTQYSKKSFSLLIFLLSFIIPFGPIVYLLWYFISKDKYRTQKPEQQKESV